MRPSYRSRDKTFSAFQKLLFLLLNINLFSINCLTNNSFVTFAVIISLLCMIVLTFHCCYCLVTKSHPPLLQLHRLQPARLLCLWNSPGKTTGGSCHFLLQVIFPTQGLLLFFFKFYFIFKLYITVLVLPDIKMNPPQQPTD